MNDDLLDVTLALLIETRDAARRAQQQDIHQASQLQIEHEELVRAASYAEAIANSLQDSINELQRMKKGAENGQGE